jgi:hypothetical protein
MFSVELDRTKRLLVISTAGRVSAAEMKQSAERVRELLSDVEPGFRALTDFRWLDFMETGAATHIADVMDTLAAKKVSTVVRVVPDPRKDIGLNILSQFRYGAEIHVVTFETLADALQSLSEAEAP